MILNFFGAIGVWQLLLIGLVLCIFIFPIIALVSVLKNDFRGNEKLIWTLIVLLLPFIGTILYFIIGRPKRIKASAQP